MKNDAKKRGLIAAGLLLLIVISFGFTFGFLPTISGAYGDVTNGDTEARWIYNEAAGFYNIAGQEDVVDIDGRPPCKSGTDYTVCSESAAVAANKPAMGEEVGPSRYNAKSALLMHYGTGEILQSQNENERRPIASMVKIMTLILIFEEIEKGNLSVQQDVTASETAAGMGGSQAFLDANAEYNVGELIKAIVVASANDACVALAEHISGDVPVFVAKMNDKAVFLGLNNTNFVNCTGLPAPNQFSSARDVAVMMRELIRHEMFFDYSKVWMFDFAHPGGRVTGLSNTNKLVRFYNGCDGGKTGFTSEALYCLATTAKRGETRLISVIIASPSAKERNAEVSRMLSYGFANFETRQLVFRGLKLDAEAAVENGKAEFAPVAPEKDLFYLLKKGEKAEFSYSVEMGKVRAPAAAGSVVGKLMVLRSGEKMDEVNLVLLNEVKKASYLDIINRVIGNW
ncbi:MAG: D-alanyl-D-alanine carboxypeptidase, partial [Firmicutes bacterium]|nr:D-alanyl-D-alanine carboxypeptidase [Bacillota bacterium]